jgi:hypothetical protein
LTVHDEAIGEARTMTTKIVEEPRGGATEQEHRAIEHGPGDRTVRLAQAGTTTEAVGAAAAIVLSIIGLAGGMPRAMMVIGTIVLGAAILLDAASSEARSHLFSTEARAGEGQIARAERVGGVSAEYVAGIAGIVLAVLALLRISPTLLCSIALVVLGAGLLFASPAKARGAASGEALVGLGAIALGILAMLGLKPVTLVLVGLLAVGAAVFLSCSAFGARLFGTLRHAR